MSDTDSWDRGESDAPPYDDQDSQWYWMCFAAQLLSAKRGMITADDAHECVRRICENHVASFFGTPEYEQFALGHIILPICVTDSLGDTKINTCVRFFELTTHQAQVLAAFGKHLRRVATRGVYPKLQAHRLRFFLHHE